MKSICKECRSEDVTRDAIVRWDQWHQVWDISAIYDSSDCHNCGASGNSILEFVEDEAEV
jgi:hypothetical protein